MKLFHHPFCLKEIKCDFYYHKGSQGGFSKKLVRLVVNNKIHKLNSNCQFGTIIKQQIPTESVR